MTTGVFLTVLLAALIHAVWNAAIKGSDDKLRFMTGLVLGHVPFALGALLFVPLPNLASWPYVVAGAVLHFGYQLFLQRSYRHGDLTHVYPLARGSAPLLTAAISVLWLGEQLNEFAWAGILVIAIGLISLVFVRRADGLWDRQSATMALATGAFIAAYSIVDGLGARVAETAIGFYAMLALLNAGLMTAYIGWRQPGMMTALFRAPVHRPLLAGGASFTAFALVIWAFTQAPIALVAALRETSVIFALLIGVVVLKERLNLLKVFATAVTTSGVLLTRLSR
jgi:drug/metabolite transporter (DMT)-like permease